MKEFQAIGHSQPLQGVTLPGVEEIEATCLEKLRGYTTDRSFFGCVVVFPLQIR